MNRWPMFFRVCLALLLAGVLFPAQASETGERRGFLYEFCRGERCGLLFGTIHVGQPEWFPLPPAQQARLDAATRIVLEADLSRADRVAEAFQRHGFYPPGQPGLESELEPELRQRVEAALPAAGLETSQAWRLKPWLLASTLTMGQAGAAGYGVAAAVETQLVAQARGRPVDELEGVEFQFRLFDAAPRAVQHAFLAETLAAIDSGEARGEVVGMAQAWLDGDEAAVLALLQAMQQEASVGGRFTVEQLVSGRHPYMIERIEYFMAAGGTPLIAVGSLHLFGPQGLIEQLRQRGWRISRV